jgi:hypothetical protein
MSGRKSGSWKFVTWPASVQLGCETYLVHGVMINTGKSPHSATAHRSCVIAYCIARSGATTKAPPTWYRRPQGHNGTFLTSSQEAGVVQAKDDWSMALIHSNADFFQVHVVVSVGLEALNQIAIFFVDLRVLIFVM